MKHTTALAVVLMLAATAMPATVADYETPAPACPFVRSVDLRGLASLRLPSFDLALDPADAVHADVSLDTAKACQDALGLADPGCILDTIRPGTDAPLPLMPRGLADFKFGAAVKTACDDVATPYMGTGLLTGILGSPLVIDVGDGTCDFIEGGSVPEWRAVVQYDYRIQDVGFQGAMPAFNSMARADIHFDLPDDNEGGILVGWSNLAEGCEFVKDSLKVQAYSDGVTWGNERLKKAPAAVHGALQLLSGRDGPLVSLEGDGAGTVHVEYTLASDVSRVGTTEWSFTSYWTAETVGSCGSLCVEGLVASDGQSSSFLS